MTILKISFWPSLDFVCFEITLCLAYEGIRFLMVVLLVIIELIFCFSSIFLIEEEVNCVNGHSAKHKIVFFIVRGRGIAK